MNSTLESRFKTCKTISDFLMIWLENDLLTQETKKTFESYYFSFIKNFDSRMQENYNLQTKEIMEISKTKRDVLEIGCGCGTESLWLSLNNANVYGIDVQTKKINVCKERKKILEKNIGKKLNCTFENVSLFDFNTSKKFDVIWIEQAFHHVEPRKEFFDVVYSLLNDGGVIVFSESNAWNPLIQLGLFKLRGFKTIIQTEMNGKEVFIGNERVITAFSLCRWLKKTGFSVKQIRYFRLFPNRSFFNKFDSLERNFPKFLRPFFTHYNLVTIKNKKSYKPNK